MRILCLAPMLAALLMAAPAAAQPDAPALLHTALDRLAADVTEVDDYTFTLSHAGVRVPVYVHRTGQSWEVRMPPTPLGDLVGMAVFWPRLLDPAASVGLEHARYLRDETVDDRRAHVVDAALGAGFGAEPDSVRVLVDPATGRIVRMVVAAAVPGEAGASPFGDGARMAIVVDAGEPRAWNGLSLPDGVRLRMRLDLPGLAPAQREAMAARFRQVRDQLREGTDPRAPEMLALMDVYLQMLTPAGLDVRLRVEDVAVNPGPPGWLADGGR